MLSLYERKLHALPLINRLLLWSSSLAALGATWLRWHNQHLFTIHAGNTSPLSQIHCCSLCSLLPELEWVLIAAVTFGAALENIPIFLSHSSHGWLYSEWSQINAVVLKNSDRTPYVSLVSAENSETQWPLVCAFPSPTRPSTPSCMPTNLPWIFGSIFPDCGHLIAWRHFCSNRRHQDWATYYPCFCYPKQWALSSFPPSL